MAADRGHPEPLTQQVIGILRDLKDFFPADLVLVLTDWATNIRQYANPPGSAVSAPVDAVAATNTLTNNTTNVTAGNTVTIGTKVYTFVATVATEGDVLRGGSADASLLNLARAINGTGGTPGTDYQVAVANADVSSTATVTAHAITLTARTKGVIGNAIGLSNVAVTLTPGGALFTGGIDGTAGYRGQWLQVTDATDYLYYCCATATIATSGAWRKITLGSL